MRVEYMWILGHRGVKKEKENSLEGLIGIKEYEEEKYELGIECDIQLTEEGEIICYHDNDLLRRHKRKKKVRELKEQELIEYDIVKLERVLEELENSQYIINIEMKTYEIRKEGEKEYCKKVLELISSKNIRSVITSFNKEIIKMMLKDERIKNERVGYIIDEEEEIETLEELRHRGIGIVVMNKKFLGKIGRREGERMMIYTLFNGEDEEGDEKILEEAKRKGVGVISDAIEDVIRRM